MKNGSAPFDPEDEEVGYTKPIIPASILSDIEKIDNALDHLYDHIEEIDEIIDHETVFGALHDARSGLIYLSEVPNTRTRRFVMSVRRKIYQLKTKNR